MTVFEIPQDRSELLLHSWIADLARYYSVASTPSYDVVTVQTGIILDNLPVTVYVRSLPRHFDQRFTVDDGGFALDRLTGLGRKPTVPMPRAFLSRRISRVIKPYDVQFSRGVIHALSGMADLRETVLTVAKACAAAVRR